MLQLQHTAIEAERYTVVQMVQVVVIGKHFF